MWILALNSRLYWLLPHRTYSIGRSHELDFVVNDASVSRRHATIEVQPPTPDAHLHPSVRSDLIITDLDSRFGTKMDKKVVKGPQKAPQTPSGMVGVQLGRSTKLHFRWVPFSVAYSTGETGEAHETLWNHAVELLRPLDIKILPYIVQGTNILCRTGSTTSSLYYALVKGIPVVNTQFFHALVDAATEYSKQGTDSESAVPDWSPYCPNKQWKPIKERSQCLSGCKFHIDQQRSRDVALAPILSAAGAECDDNPGFIHLVHSEEKTDLPNAKYVTDRAIFSAIVECRGLRKQDIRPEGEAIPDSGNKAPSMDRTSTEGRKAPSMDRTSTEGRKAPSMDRTSTEGRKAPSMNRNSTERKGKPSILDKTGTEGEPSLPDKATSKGRKGKSSILDKMTGTESEPRILDKMIGTEGEPSLLDVTSTEIRKAPSMLDKATSNGRKGKSSILDKMTGTEGKSSILDKMTGTEGKSSILDKMTGTEGEPSLVDKMTGTEGKSSLLDKMASTEGELDKATSTEDPGLDMTTDQSLDDSTIPGWSKPGSSNTGKNVPSTMDGTASDKSAQPKKSKLSLLDIMTQSSQPAKGETKAKGTPRSSQPETKNGKRKPPSKVAKPAKRPRVNVPEIQEEEEEPLDTSLELDPTFNPATFELCISTRPATPPEPARQHTVNFKAFKNRSHRQPAYVPYDTDMAESTVETMSEPTNAERETLDTPGTRDAQANTSVQASLNIDEDFGFTFT